MHYSTFFIFLITYSFHISSVCLFSLPNIYHIDDNFDYDFADSMCKPLPEWYTKQQIQEFNKEELKQEEFDFPKINNSYIALPSWIEVFPEFEFIFSIVREKINEKINEIKQWKLCKRDDDCPFPQTCCDYPFFDDTICCSGLRKRKLKLAYIGRIINPN